MVPRIRKLFYGGQVDEKLRSAEQAFNAEPNREGALAALSLGLRSGEPPALALSWVLSLERWDDHPQDLQDLAARCVECLHPAFVYQGLREFSLADTSHRIGVFLHAGRECSLIPAGRVELGYDASALTPTPKQLSEVRLALDDKSTPPQELLFSLMKDAITPLREVDLSPFLIETQARPFAEHEEAIGDVDELEEFTHDGLRLPHTDEWELACGAGTTSLFRWGDDCPKDQSPYDAEPWNLHRRPNAFGLTLAGNSYETELVVPEGVRGGDGGSMVCGGGPHYLAWLTLATAHDPSPALFGEGDLGITDCEPGLRLVLSVFP